MTHTRASISGYTLQTASAVVPQQDVPVLAHAIDLLTHVEQTCADAEEAARAKGYEQGLAEGRRKAGEELAAAHLELLRAADAEREHNRASLGELALAIIQRIAEDLGDAETVASLAMRAARDALTQGPLKIHVHPDHVPMVTRRVAQLEAPITVQADDQLGFGGCRLESALGEIEAGLDIQLTALREAFARNVPVAAKPPVVVPIGGAQ